jgi:hypothetical protein
MIASGFPPRDLDRRGFPRRDKKPFVAPPRENVRSAASGCSL